MYSTPPAVAGAILAHNGGTRAIRNFSVLPLICSSPPVGGSFGTRTDGSSFYISSALGNGTRDFSRGLAAKCVWVQQKTESFPVRGHKTDMALERHSRLHHEWRPGAVYFITWLLYGSLPVSRVATLDLPQASRRFGQRTISSTAYGTRFRNRGSSAI